MVRNKINLLLFIVKNDRMVSRFPYRKLFFLTDKSFWNVIGVVGMIISVVRLPRWPMGAGTDERHHDLCLQPHRELEGPRTTWCAT